MTNICLKADGVFCRFVLVAFAVVALAALLSHNRCDGGLTTQYFWVHGWYQLHMGCNMEKSSKQTKKCNFLILSSCRPLLATWICHSMNLVRLCRIHRGSLSHEKEIGVKLRWPERKLKTFRAQKKKASLRMNNWVPVIFYLDENNDEFLQTHELHGSGNRHSLFRFTGAQGRCSAGAVSPSNANVLRRHKHEDTFRGYEEGSSSSLF